MVNPKRVRKIKEGKKVNGPVVYWMSRDQRLHDNWALLFAQEIADKNNLPLIIIFNLVDNFLEASIRQYGFMLKGLEEIEAGAKEYSIPFYLLAGNPENKIPEFLTKLNAGALVTDFDPLKIKRKWKKNVSEKINIPFYEVDAHNIVPCFYVTDKEEYAAYTFRPKIHKALVEFLEEYPPLKPNKNNHVQPSPKIDWIKVRRSLKINFKVKEIDWIIPGETAANNALMNFIQNKIAGYAAGRNNPVKDAQSNLSPYLHFGHLSSQRAALMAEKEIIESESAKAFLEELIVRKELADNFCYYNKNYDSFEGFAGWAKKTLNEHRDDQREYVYSLNEFEKAETHEDLWNAAQRELAGRGKLHGYMRMYWAKKILEWSKSPEEAMRIAIYLNDKYELDGRDPNGYIGCAWAIGGIHDRAWSERPVYGKIRYMNRNGSKAKFDVVKYVEMNSYSD